MKDLARVVIIGGGITGCSIAYHLTEMGWRDVILLDKGELTSGATFHAAGLVGQLRSSVNITKMLKYSVDLYSRLEEKTGQHTGWSPVGGLRIASSRDRLEELRRSAAMAKSFGLPMELITPEEDPIPTPPAQILMVRPNGQNGKGNQAEFRRRKLF